LSDFSFSKKERITSRKILSSLFSEGKAIQVHPLRIIYQSAPAGNHPAAVAIAVPKRIFRKAADRNLLKRRIREAYRLNKPFFHSNLRKLDRGVNLVILYQHHQKVDYHSIHDALQQGLEILLQEIS